MFPTVKKAVKLHTTVHVGSGEDEEQNGGRRDCLDILVGMTLTYASATVNVLLHRVGDPEMLRPRKSEICSCSSSWLFSVTRPSWETGHVVSCQSNVWAFRAKA